MKHKFTRPVLGITMGDPAGIGPEICLRALREPSVLKRCVPVLFGDAAVLDRVAAGLLAGPGRARRGISQAWLRALPRLHVAAFEKLHRVKDPLIVDCAAIDAKTLQLEKFPPRADAPPTGTSKRRWARRCKVKSTASSPRPSTRSRCAGRA